MQVSAPSPAELADQLLRFMLYLTKTTQDGVLHVAAELDLTLSQLRALFHLAYGDHDPALSELAQQIGLSVAATGRAVDALVRSDLVARREDEADRRVKRLSLTTLGEDVLGRIAAARREGLRQFAEALDDDARAQFARALSFLPANLPCEAAPTSETTTTS
jgi:DNA-binding MarR family transcriptional regulator